MNKNQKYNLVYLYYQLYAMNILPTRASALLTCIKLLRHNAYIMTYKN